MVRCSALAADSSARACYGIQRTETMVAVGLEQTHAEFLSPGQSLLVAGPYSPFTLYNCLCM